MADLLIVFPAFLQLFGEFILALGGCCHFTGIVAVIHHILHSVDLGLIHTLHLVQVVDTQVADGIRCIAMQVNQCLEAVLLATVKQPVDRTLTGASDRVSLAVILEEVVQEVIADYFPAGAALIAEGFCDIVKVGFQRISTVHCFQPCTQTRYDIIVQIFLIGDRDNIVSIREEHFIYHNTLIAVCAFQLFSRNRSWAFIHLIHKCLQGIRFSRKKQAILIGRVTAKHTTHRIAQQALDVPLQVSFAHSHIFILHFRVQLVLQTVNVNKNAVQLFFVDFQPIKSVVTFRLPLGKGFGNRGNVAEQRVLLKVPRGFKRVPILFRQLYISFCYLNNFSFILFVFLNRNA